MVGGTARVSDQWCCCCAPLVEAPFATDRAAKEDEKESEEEEEEEEARFGPGNAVEVEETRRAHAGGCGPSDPGGARRA